MSLRSGMISKDELKAPKKKDAAARTCSYYKVCENCNIDFVTFNDSSGNESHLCRECIKKEAG